MTIHKNQTNTKLKNSTINIVVIHVFISKDPINPVFASSHDQKEKKPLVIKDARLVLVEDVQLKIKSSEKKRNVNVNDKKGNEINAVVPVKKSLILKMDVAKNAFGPSLKIEKPVFVRFLNQYVRQNSLLKAVSFVDVMGVIQET